MSAANDKMEDGLPVHDAHHRCAFLNDETENNDGSRMMTLPIQAREKKDYDCEKANHRVEMISKKRLEKRNDGLVMKINQTQAHHSGGKEDCKSAKTDDAAERIQEQMLEPYSEFVSKNTQQKRRVLSFSPLRGSASHGRVIQ